MLTFLLFGLVKLTSLMLTLVISVCEELAHLFSLKNGCSCLERFDQLTTDLVHSLVCEYVITPECGQKPQLTAFFIKPHLVKRALILT